MRHNNWTKRKVDPERPFIIEVDRSENAYGKTAWKHWGDYASDSDREVALAAAKESFPKLNFRKVDAEPK